MLRKIHIENYRVFRSFTLDFNEGLNVLVGNNDAGKSTLLEAVHVGLTGRLRGRLFEAELSPFLFNQETTAEFVEGIQAGTKPPPPKIIIELYL